MTFHTDRCVATIALPCICETLMYWVPCKCNCAFSYSIGSLTCAPWKQPLGQREDLANGYLACIEDGVRSERTRATTRRIFHLIIPFHILSIVFQLSQTRSRFCETADLLRTCRSSMMDPNFYNQPIFYLAYAHTKIHIQDIPSSYSIFISSPWLRRSQPRSPICELADLL